MLLITRDKERSMDLGIFMSVFQTITRLYFQHWSGGDKTSLHPMRRTRRQFRLLLQSLGMGQFRVLKLVVSVLKSAR